MQIQPTLYMVLLGATPPDRLTEQHDVFFGAGISVKALKADMYAFWHNAGQLHIDSWRAVTHVDGYEISVVPKAQYAPTAEKLFFINLGGYKPADPEEYHYKMLVVAKSMAEAVKASKQTLFYKHYGFTGAVSHVDNKFALDVDDVHQVEDVMPTHFKEMYAIAIEKTDALTQDELHVGYVKLGPL